MRLSFAFLRAALIVAALVGVPPDAESGGSPGVRVAAGDGFVAGIEDLPLMPGLHPVAEESFVFTKAVGRIVHAVARGTVSTEAVARFYAESAPQLGWRSLGNHRFTRDGEVLRLEILPAAKPGSPRLTTVRFDLSPE
ncbi:MAG: hypothetical protein GC191_18860 [Azospirillum sp.]|nr:hypothetical protein [Azospirillum sp.]